MPASNPHIPDLPNLPSEFLEFNGEAPEWLQALPGRLQRLCDLWSLRLGPHFPGIRINYVARAWRADGRSCVLKVSRFVDETTNEIAALRQWDGDGAVRLLAGDPAQGALLLEALDPGTMLVEVARSDDDAATTIAAGLLRQLWRPRARVTSGANGGLRTLASWCAAYDCNRAALLRGDRGFPAALFQRADALRAELLASTTNPVILHGDLHHYNILRAQRAPWLAIDPKGLYGDRCFDVCQFLRNPDGDAPPPVNRRRLDIFCAELGLDRPRTRDWCFVHAVLDACWDYEDGNPWQRTIAYAEQALTY